ncbi:MAG: DUF192 domain-containing protein [Alphaproteobacteria bacterium]
MKKHILIALAILSIPAIVLAKGESVIKLPIPLTHMEEEVVKQEPAAPQPIVPGGEIFLTDDLVIKKQNGEHINLTAELALSGAQQAQGLMHRTEMAKDHGMLFVFNKERDLGFWMKNTLIPLDMLFIAKDGEIHHIHHNARPQDLTTITSERDALAVLELNGGMADKLGITEGDVVVHSTFKNEHLP